MEAYSKMLESYNYLNSLLKSNTGTSISIDYSKLDGESREEISKAIDHAIIKRRTLISREISGVNLR